MANIKISALQSTDKIEELNNEQVKQVVGGVGASANVDLSQLPDLFSQLPQLPDLFSQLPQLPQLPVLP